MPSYNTHRGFNYIAFIAVVALLYFKGQSFLDLYQFIVLVAGFYIGTEFVTPDLDVESRAINRWGPLKVLWWPYMWMFKHGQSSHNIFYGAVVRVLYFSLIIAGLYYLIFKTVPTDITIPAVFLYVLLAGIVLANALHVMLDMLF
jgi:uncharacterized metal-binding protein